MLTLSVAVSPDEQGFSISGLCSDIIRNGFLILDNVSSRYIKYAPTLLYQLQSQQEHQRVALASKNASSDTVR